MSVYRTIGPLVIVYALDGCQFYRMSADWQERDGLYIRKTCPCNVYPTKPHFYIEKLGYAGVYLFFLFLLKT